MKYEPIVEDFDGELLFNFGKYKQSLEEGKGKTIYQVAVTDPGHLQWWVKTQDQQWISKKQAPFFREAVKIVHAINQVHKSDKLNRVNDKYLLIRVYLDHIPIKDRVSGKLIDKEIRAWDTEGIYNGVFTLGEIPLEVIDQERFNSLQIHLERQRNQIKIYPAAPAFLLNVIPKETPKNQRRKLANYVSRQIIGFEGKAIRPKAKKFIEDLMTRVGSPGLTDNILNQIGELSKEIPKRDILMKRKRLESIAKKKGEVEEIEIPHKQGRLFN